MKKQNEKLQTNCNLYLATCAANLTTLSAGCTMTWTSPTLPKLLEKNDQIVITKEEGAWIGSLLPLGACLGPLLITLIVDKIGKKLSALISTSFILLHWLIIAMINSLEAIYLARFIAGMAVGTIFNLIPVYVAEISTNETRGLTGSLFLLFLYIGCCIPYNVGPYTSFSTLILVVASIPLLTMIIFIWIPESPYYLLNKGKRQQAYASLQLLRTHLDKSVIQQEIVDLQEILQKTQAEKLNTKKMISHVIQVRNLKSIYYAGMLIFFQQMAGYNAVLFYSEAVFEQSSLSISSSTATIICGLVMMCSAIIVPFMGKLFRIKNILCFSASGCFLFLIILGIYFKVLEHGNVGECFSWIPIICIIGYIVSHSLGNVILQPSFANILKNCHYLFGIFCYYVHVLGFGGYVWVIVAEIFHPSVKTIASAFTTSLCWFLCFCVTRFFITFINVLGSSNTFWLFALFCLLALIFIVVQLPDTQGKSFQEIQDLIGGKKNLNNDEEVNPH